MDSRKCSAALGFALLIGCVIGIVILIHNSGSSRKSSESSSSSSSVLHDPQLRHRPPPTTIVGGKAGSGSDHFGSSPKDGFANDPNYRSSQPTMQEVNELADELHRILSPKSKHVHSTTGGNGKGNPVNTGTVTSVRKTNGSLASSSATSSAKASITAVNYSSVPKKSLSGSPPASMGSMTPVPALPTPVTPSISPDSALPNRNHPLTSSSVNNEQEVPLTNYHQKQQHNHHNSKPYSGHQSPPYFSPLPSLITTQMMADSAERQALAPHEMKGRGGSSGGGGSLVHNDLYTTSWHPSIASPAGGGMAAPNHPYHHLRNHPQSHRPHNNNPQPPRPSSPAKINRAGKGAGYPLNQNHNRAPIPTQYQHGYHHYRHDHEKVEIDEDEDGDFVEVDDDDEDDVSGNPGNVKKEEEWGDDNDIADDNEEDEEEEDGEEEDEEDNGANPGFLMEPKNFAADLETLFSVANHLYTSPASLLSAFSAQAKTNSTNKADTDTPTFGLPTAFQGFLKVINETIQRSNNSKLLVELNEKYQGREARMSSNSKTNSNNGNSTNKSSSAVGKTSSTSDVKKTVEEDKQQSPYEKSLASFVFMSFGVFLLNQIHSFVQKTAEEHLRHHKLMGNESVGEGRALPWEESGPFTWYSPKSEMIMTTESSSLDILFQSPVSPNGSSVISGNSSSSVSGRSNDQLTLDGEGIMPGEDHVNNMFRALLNIANAYTKDSPAVECIWSLYCKDLDQTAHKEGLYGVAARINSVGLRLIMKQIPPALTFDVILRSLVGWDGLPCRKMFPECAAGNGTISMVSADESGGVKKVATNVL